MKIPLLRRGIVTAAVLGLLSPVSVAVAQDNVAPSISNAVSVSDDVFGETANVVSPRQGCRIIVWEVGQTNQALGVRGGREGCSNYATYTVDLRRNRTWLPDESLATATGGGNSTAVAYAGCKGTGTYFGEVRSSTGNKAQGPRLTRC